jgi:hypothetical protein
MFGSRIAGPWCRDRRAPPQMGSTPTFQESHKWYQLKLLFIIKKFGVAWLRVNWHCTRFLDQRIRIESLIIESFGASCYGLECAERCLNSRGGGTFNLDAGVALWCHIGRLRSESAWHACCGDSARIESEVPPRGLRQFRSDWEAEDSGREWLAIKGAAVCERAVDMLKNTMSERRTGTASDCLGMHEWFQMSA